MKLIASIILGLVSFAQFAEGLPPKANIPSGPNSIPFPVSFKFQIVGKPTFQVPSATSYQAYVYKSKAFSYPLSMMVSKTTEFKQPFFIGIEVSNTVGTVTTVSANSTASSSPIKVNNPAIPPAAPVSYSNGIYVDSNYVLKWNDSNDSTVILDRVIPIYGVLASLCNVAMTTPYNYKTLVRYDIPTGKMVTCKIPNTSLTASGSLANVTLSLRAVTDLNATPAPITSVEVSRTPSVYGSIDQQFSDFLARCDQCKNISPVSSAGSIETNTTSTFYHLTNPTANSFVKYNSSTYESRFEVVNVVSNQVNKIYRDSNPIPSHSISIMASKGENLSFKATTNASNTAPFHQYRWYVNGCLKAAGQANGSPILFDLKVTSQMSGANDDCTGEFGFAESNAKNLGQLIVRLSISNGTETLDSAAVTDASAVFYLWKVSVLNSDPTVITAVSTPAPSGTPVISDPIVFNASYRTGNQPIQYMMPVTFNAKNYLAFTDLSNSSVNSLKIRMREFDANGSIYNTSSQVVLNCASDFLSQPTWIGIQPNGNKLSIAASSDNTYPIGNTANLIYGLQSKTCYQKDIPSPQSGNTMNSNYLSLANNSSVPAGILAFSKYRMSNKVTSSFTTGSIDYQTGTTGDSSYFLLDGSNAKSQFWIESILSSATPNPSIYTTTPVALKAPFTTNVVRKNIVPSDAPNKLFQLVGSGVENGSNWRGYVIMSTLSQRSSPKSLLLATPTASVMFSDGSGVAPFPTANDCNFNGTPVDGIYVSAMDTLFVYASSTLETNGQLVAIKNASTGSPVCSRVDMGNAKIANPSLVAGNYNTNISKMAFDSNTGTIYGLVKQVSGVTQLYTFDIYSQNLAVRNLTVSGYEMILLPKVLKDQPFGAYIFDGTQTLYKVW